MRAAAAALLSAAAAAGAISATKPPPSPAVAKLEQKYGAMQNASCAKVAPKVPPLPAADQKAFMAAYQAFKGTGDEQKVTDLASKVLTDKGVAAFLTLADTFTPGGFDASLVQCALIADATPLVLAEYAAQGTAQEASVDQLLADAALSRDMLLAGGANAGKYGEAMGIYQNILKASTMPKGSVQATGATLWDDRDQKTVLHRLALGTALQLAVPLNERWGGTTVDPVARYTSMEKAYQAGDLDPAFEVLTAFELRYVAENDATDADMTWLRETMAIFRPEHIVLNDTWRYSRAVRTDVAYGATTWPDGVPRYSDVPAAGGVCGIRAFFGRFCRRTFGLPSWGFPQPGHGAMTTWGPDGWVVELGASWPHGHGEAEHGDRSGPDFQLETLAREYRADYQKVLRGQWAAAALGETPVSPEQNPSNPKSLGTGGDWSALMLYQKKISAAVKAPSRPIGPSVVPTKVAAFAARWTQPQSTPKITVGPDGSITIPAAALSAKNHSAPVTVTPSFGGGQQLAHGSGNFIDPAATSFEYSIDDEAGGTYYLTTNFSAWHTNCDLQFATDTMTTPAYVPVFYTGGYWAETQPVEVTLKKGTNVLRFTRQLGAQLVFKQFFLLKKKPVIPQPPGNHTPAPAPPPVDRYIMLHQGLTCTSQGILDLDDKECGYAAAHFGYKYTGVRPRPNQYGCWVLISGPYKGNANLNSNKTGACCGPIFGGDTQSLCLRS